MTLAQLINRPCKLILRTPSGEDDDFGDETLAVNEVESLWELQQRSSGESEEEVSGDLWMAFFLPDISLEGLDAIEDEELGRFELDGDPWPVRNPRTQAASHIEARVRRASAQEAGS